MYNLQCRIYNSQEPQLYIVNYKFYIRKDDFMAINKVVYGAAVLVDLTEDTVSADNLLSGYTAHDKSGKAVTGTLSVQNCYTGTGIPSSSLGKDGDLYLDLG